MNHEQYIHAVRELAVKRLDSDDLRAKLLNAKLVYGVGGERGARGVTYYSGWKNGDHHEFMEVCARGEESPVQLAGTTIHELAHVLAGNLAGHRDDWKTSCHALGLTRAEASGQNYKAEDFDADLWTAISALEQPSDGAPAFGSAGSGFVGLPPLGKFKPCPLGIGTRGGKSRGTGSGSRLRKHVCGCGVIARVASDEFLATCDRCGTKFSIAIVN